ncbi:MAG: hypothetical protein QM301_05885, partial [Bacteroidota bacterium]|nr:hypothetical protein [Bacteroidota bacterium]
RLYVLKHIPKIGNKKPRQSQPPGQNQTKLNQLMKKRSHQSIGELNHCVIAVHFNIHFFITELYNQALR